MKPSLIDHALVSLLVFLLENSPKDTTYRFIKSIEDGLSKGQITNPKHLLRIRMVLPKITHLL